MKIKLIIESKENGVVERSVELPDDATQKDIERAFQKYLNVDYIWEQEGYTKIRKCCGKDPIWCEGFYPGTVYRLIWLECPVCHNRTQKKRRSIDVIAEWNNPEKVVLN